MASTLAAILDIVFGFELGSTAQDTGNRICMDGLTWSRGPDGALQLAARSMEVTSLRLASGPLTIEVGRLALHKISGQLRIEGGRPRWSGLDAGSAEVTGLKVHGPLVLSRKPEVAASHAKGGAAGTAGTAPGQAAAGPWNLGPLATAEGTLRAEIVDAHLLFDAEVTVPIRQGVIDFNAATVEHVGPDSRMGVSRMGLYVDAPNGRSYLYQFPTAPVAGVEYERRSAMPGPWGSQRGSLQLQPFGEGLLRQPPGAHGLGFTEQARLLFERTAVSGEVRLGDGAFAAPGVQADLAGRAAGHNTVRLHSQAVGRGFSADVASLSVSNVAVNTGGAQLACDEVTGALMLRVLVEGAQLRVAFELPGLKVAGLRLRLDGAA